MPLATIVVLIAVALMTLLLPLGVMLLLRRRGGSWTAFLTGAGTFVLFALVLEPILHSLVLRSPAGAAIQGNILLYGLYGGLAAGLFEETGRLLAFRLVLKKSSARITALSYGIGHGGIEALLLVGLTMVSNLLLGLAHASGAPLPQETAAAAEALLAIPAATFLWSGLERLSAMALHMALSVLVFASVRTEKHWLFPAAILVHASVNFAAVAANARLPIAATEALVLLLTALAALWAAGIYRRLPRDCQAV